MFVTALHESLQIEQEFASTADNHPIHIMSTPAELPATSAYYQRYGRDPKQFQPPSKPRGTSARTFTPRRTYAPAGHTTRSAEALTFDEARRRNICLKCRAAWKPGHRCSPGSVRDNYSQRIANGERAVHLVSDLVQAIELETDTNPDPVSDLPDHTVRFADQDQDASENDLYMFDNRIGYVEHESELPHNVNYVHPGTEDESERFIHHLQGSMGQSSGSSFRVSNQFKDFRQSDAA